MDPVDNPVKLLLKELNNQALRDYIVLCSEGYIRNRRQIKRFSGETIVGIKQNVVVSELLHYINNGDYERIAELTESFDDVETVFRRAEAFATKPGFNYRKFLKKESTEEGKPEASRPKPRILQT